MQLVMWFCDTLLLLRQKPHIVPAHFPNTASGHPSESRDFGVGGSRFILVPPARAAGAAVDADLRLCNMDIYASVMTTLICCERVKILGRMMLTVRSNVRSRAYDLVAL